MIGNRLDRDRMQSEAAAASLEHSPHPLGAKFHPASHNHQLDGRMAQEIFEVAGREPLARTEP
jgi:hypothetical protein